MSTRIMTLGTVAQYINGRAFRPEEWETRGLPIIRIQNLTNPDSKYNYTTVQHEEKYLIRNGDLLFAWSASLGAHIWKNGNAWLNQHIFKVIPNEGVDRDYLYYYLLKVVNELYQKAHGTGMVHITKAPFMATPIPVPEFSIQKQIVNRIEESLSQLDSAVETLKKTKQQLGIYRQAVVEDAIEAGKRHGAQTLQFGDTVLQYQNGISKRSGEGKKTPVLRLADIEKQQIKIDNEYRYIGLSEQERAKYLLNKGDLLVIRVNGSVDNVGRSIIVPKEAAFAACDHFIRCKVKSSCILPEYVQLCLDSFSSRNHIRDNMVSTAGQNTVSQATMNGITIYVPDISIQKEILNAVNERISVCNSIKQTVNQSLLQAEALRQSILKQAFEGGRKTCLKR